MSGSLFLSTQQVSTITGIPAATLRFWRHKGDEGPPSFRLGPRRIVYRQDLLNEWLAEQEATTQRGGGAA
ncbi:hypothetical protein MAHJHV49_11550 [Mycobacterium avium subsp. hominissuis]|uniref:DNA-binding protein n=1 Tax=Mycobacterium alsense TaxID=324058 RepID=A0AA41Y0F4_9MYCO|nr:helix-turn-helix domain-containing protein [Mycobacterium alsense]MCV7382174.1 helix-turn-helix domain-containing protein [Mycobacterium alsense]OQZ90372.1 DNA-binding protein [Mycobacterium alsense]